MQKTKFLSGLKILLVLTLVFGVLFNVKYFYYELIKWQSTIRIITLFFVQFTWIGAVLLLYFKSELVYEKRNEILLSLIVFAFCFAIVEIGIRVIDERRPIYSRHHYLNYYGTPNYRSKDGLNQHNSLGFRGDEIEMPKPESTYRIAIIGGSSVYTIMVKDWTKDWPRQLEKELKKKYENIEIDVVNGGIGGYNSWESLINLEFRILDLDPDLIIIYMGTNDVHARLIPPDYYTSDNSGRRKQWESKPCLSIFCLRIVQKITQKGLSLNFDVNAPTYSATADPGYSEKLGMTPMEALEENKPIYFERNLRNMIAIADEHSIAVVLSTWTYSDKFGDYITTPHYASATEENNNVVKIVGESHNIPVYDFASEMPKDKIYWADGRHLNEKGAELKGKLFADYIYNSNIIEDKFTE